MRFFCIISSIFFFFSCSEYQKVLKSDNIEYKYTKALEYYNAADYLKSLQLLETVLTNFNDRQKSEEVYYHYIYATFYIKDYISAAYHFNNFCLKFPSSSKKEEMSYMSAYCYYLQAPRYNLDQTNTYDAIIKLEAFIDSYPNSSRIKEATQLIIDLNLKLEKKEFEIVKLYFETGKYMASISSVDDFLNRFPETSNKEEVFFIQTQSYYELGINSIEEKKAQRIKDAIFACNNFLLAFPSGNYTQEIESIYQKLKEIQNGL